MVQARATIRDVARVAGVSIATVSRVANGGMVSLEAKRRVQAAMEELGYRLNHLARSLVTGRSGVIGVIVPDVTGPLYGAMLRGIEEGLEGEGLVLISASSQREPLRGDRAIRLLLERRVEALILIGSGATGTDPGMLARGVPAVVIEPENDSIPMPAALELDNVTGGLRATRHLITLGHEIVAHVTGVRRAGADRAQGYRRALAGAGLESGPEVPGDFSEESGYRAARLLLRDHPEVTAVYYANDRMALGAYRAYAEAGLAVGRDISVIGYDDLAFAPFLAPPLSTVRLPAMEMGRQAARRALELVSGGESAPPSLIEPELVPRSSTRRLEAAGVPESRTA